MEAPERLEQPEVMTRAQARYRNALDILGSQPLTPTGRVKFETVRIMEAEGF